MFLESERKKVKSLSRVQLCDPVDCSLPGSSLHGILQAGILEWVAISFSRGSAQPRDRTRVSCVGGGCYNLWATKDMFLESQMLFWLRKPKLALSMYYYIKIEFPFLLMKLQSPEKVLTHSQEFAAHGPSLGMCYASWGVLTLGDPMNHSLSSSSVLGILQARILGWIPCPPPRHCPHPGTEPSSLTSAALAGDFFLSPAFAGRYLTTSTTWEAPSKRDWGITFKLNFITKNCAVFP